MAVDVIEEACVFGGAAILQSWGRGWQTQRDEQG